MLNPDKKEVLRNKDGRKSSKGEDQITLMEAGWDTDEDFLPLRVQVA